MTKLTQKMYDNIEKYQKTNGLAEIETEKFCFNVEDDDCVVVVDEYGAAYFLNVGGYINVNGDNGDLTDEFIETLKELKII